MLFSGLFSKNKQRGKKLFENISNISKFSNTVGEAKKVLKDTQEQEYSHEFMLLQENSKDYYISLDSFLKLLDKKDLGLLDIISSCKHVGEINSILGSCVEVFAIPQQDNILLCVEKPEGYKGDKIKIITVRKSS